MISLSRLGAGVLYSRCVTCVEKEKLVILWWWLVQRACGDIACQRAEALLVLQVGTVVAATRDPLAQPTCLLSRFSPPTTRTRWAAVPVVRWRACAVRPYRLASRGLFAVLIYTRELTWIAILVFT